MSKSLAYPLHCLGVACSLGMNKEQVLEGLLRGSREGIVERQGYFADPDKRVRVAEVPADIDTETYGLPEAYKAYESRNNRLLLAAYQQIAPQVEQVIEKYGKERIAIVLGTSTSGVSETEQALEFRAESGQWPEGYSFNRQEFGDPALFLADLLDLPGLAYGISTACSSSAKAFGSARRLLRTGMYDAVLVGGVDSLCRLTVNGFASLESISETYCRPFEQDRDGINIGEAVALFLMTQENSVSESDICFLGIGESSDAHHISAPHPEGDGAKTAMQNALTDAGLSADDVAYINLHGTATPQNDAMESKAVNSILGDATPATSTKSMTGHTLGAAGAIEAAICWLLLSTYNVNKQLPPQILMGAKDESLAPINLITETGQSLRQGVLMSNSFAFGGSNASLVFGQSKYVR